jgi:hypothetical protein
LKDFNLSIQRQQDWFAATGELKLIYQGLGVPEVWFWQNHQFSLYFLRGDKYEKIFKSEFLPDLDLTLLASLLLSGEKPKDLISKFRENIRRGN